MATMQDFPIMFRDAGRVFSTPEFQELLEDYLSWDDLTRFRVTSYIAAYHLPSWQEWHHVSAMFYYGFQTSGPLGNGLTPCQRFARWYLLMTRLEDSAPPPLTPLWRWLCQTAQALSEELFSRHLTFAEAQRVFQALVRPSTERALQKALYGCNRKLSSDDNQPTALQQQLAVYVSELSLLWASHSTLHRLMCWVVTAWIDGPDQEFSCPE